MRLITPILTLTFLASLQAQPPQTPTTWASVAYVKVPSDKMAQYEEVVSTMYAKMIQSRISAGEVTRYVHTRMILPSGSDAKYNYISATIQTGIPSLDASPADLEKAWSRAGLKRATYTAQMTALGATIVKRELWRNIERLGMAESGDFIRFDTKKVTKPMDYVNLERTYQKPYWAERMKQGAIKGWALYVVQLPGGEDRPYTHVTVQWFKDASQMLAPAAPGSANEAWKVAAPGRDGYSMNREMAGVSHTATVELGRVRMVLGQ
jgi:hypothetical protein